MGLGILAANQPTRYPKSSLGVLAQGGLQGMDAYHSEIANQLGERRLGAANALQVLSIKKALEQQEALKNFDQPSGVGGPTVSTAPLMTAPGMSPMTSTAAFGVPDYASKDIPTPAPSTGMLSNRAQVPNFRSLLAAGVPATTVNAMMEDWKLRHPELKFEGGMARDPRSGMPIQGIPATPQINPQGFGTTSRVNPQTGQIEIGVTPGAETAYATQQAIGERAKATMDLVTVPPTSAGAAPTYASRLSLLPSGGAAPDAAPPATRPRPAAGMSPEASAAQAATAAQQLDISKNYGTIYNNLQNAAMVNPAKMAKVQRISDLLGDFEGGKLSKTAMDLASVANSAGIKIDPMLPNKQAAQALSGEIALDLRSTAGGGGMPGAMSDADREFLKSLTPQLGMTADGRKTIVESKIKVMQRENQVATMARQYKKKYGALNEDFFTQLSSWAERNPIFSK